LLTLLEYEGREKEEKEEEENIKNKNYFLLLFSSKKIKTNK